MYNVLNVKSRVRGDFHARFRERVEVRFLRSTRPVTLADFSVALLDTLSANAKIWNATALGDEYGQCTKNYMDIHKEVANKLHYQTPSFKQNKQADPFPLYAVWRPVNRRINNAAPGISILND